MIRAKSQTESSLWSLCSTTKNNCKQSSTIHDKNKCTKTHNNLGVLSSCVLSLSTCYCFNCILIYYGLQTRVYSTWQTHMHTQDNLGVLCFDLWGYLFCLSLLSLCFVLSQRKIILPSYHIDWRLLYWLLSFDTLIHKCLYPKLYLGVLQQTSGMIIITIPGGKRG